MFNKPAYEELERQVRQLKRGAAHRERVEARIFSALVEHSVDAVLLTAPGGQIIFSNPAAHDLFQMTYQELVQGGRNAVVDENDPRLRDNPRITPVSLKA